MNRPFDRSRARLKRAAALLLTAVLLAASLPDLARACACGCYVFDVQTSAMIPNHPGGMAFFEYDYMDQKQNWGGASKASADLNGDKQIRTSFITAGVQYMVNRDWGYSIEVPYWDRYFKTTDSNGNVGDFTHEAVGDIRVRAIYSGLSSNMSTGLTFGLKLPTGDFEYANFDRDTQIGTGSTDALLGFYHQGALTADNAFSWFATASLDEPMIISAGYRPGAELDADAGAYYNDWNVGAFKIAPIASVIGSQRWHDQGWASASSDSGYRRLVLAPGLEITDGSWRVFGDVGFPVAQYVTGNQLVAAQLYKLNVSWSF
jgi:hypothetical protein